MPTILITGASGNLGSVVTRFFLEKGWQVIATVHNEQSGNALGTDPGLLVKVINLRDERATEGFITELTAQEAIDAAVLLVGGFAMGSLKETGSELIREQIGLNFETAYHVTRPVFQHMLTQGHGRIVFIGARPSLQPSAAKKMIAYSLSKSLLFNLANYLNEEAKGKNVSVSVVVPSTIDTKSNRESMPDADPDNWVKPGEIADVLNFIVSDKTGVLRETVLKVYKNA